MIKNNNLPKCLKCGKNAMFIVGKYVPNTMPWGKTFCYCSEHWKSAEDAKKGMTVARFQAPEESIQGAFPYPLSNKEPWDDYGLTVKVIDVRWVKADAERYGKKIDKLLAEIENDMKKHS